MVRRCDAKLLKAFLREKLLNASKFNQGLPEQLIEYRARTAAVTLKQHEGWAVSNAFNFFVKDSISSSSRV